MGTIQCAARDGCVDAFNRCWRRYVPVAAKGNHHAGVQKRSKSVCRAGAHGPDDLLGPATIVDGVVGLHAGDDTVLAEAADGAGRGVLRVFDPEPAITRAVLADDALDGVEVRVDGAVTDGVHIHLQPCCIGGQRPTIDRVRIILVDQQASVVWDVGEGLVERGSVRAQRAVDHGLEAAYAQPCVALARRSDPVTQTGPVLQRQTCVDPHSQGRAGVGALEYVEVSPGEPDPVLAERGIAHVVSCCHPLR